MKKLSVVLFALTMVIGWGKSVAFAVPYVSGNVGAVWVDDSDYSYSLGGPSYLYKDKGEISFDTGFGVTAAFGGAYANGIRAEVELGYRTADIDKIEGTETISVPFATYSEDYSYSIDGDIETLTLMLNGYFDFMPTNNVSPFVGAGIGVANTELNIENASDDDYVFAYQLAAGVAFAVNERMKIDVQYRYLGSDDPDFDGLEIEYNTHNFMVGLRHSF